MINRKILERCPTCSSKVTVTELSCESCDTVIRGHYDACPFCQLTPANIAFLLEFVRNRGNVKEMERELGVSYWTIRSRLDDVIAQFGFESAGARGKALSERRREILETLDRGEISVAEAAEMLSRLKESKDE